MSSISLVSNPAIVDNITDDKGLGYPDSRKVVRDKQGNLYIAYRNKYRMESALRYHIFVAKSTDNGATWFVLNRNRPIENTGDYNQRVPSITIDTKDTIHVVWYGLDAGHPNANDRQIKYGQSTDGGKSWKTWTNIAEITGYQDETLWQEHPVIYADRQDTLYVVWEGRDSEYKNGQIKFTQSRDGGKTWTGWHSIAPDASTYFSRPTIVATHDSATLYILAYAQLGKRHQIVWTQSADGGITWAPWATVAPDQKDQRHVSLAIDSKDQLHAVWRQQSDGLFANTYTQIHYAVYENGAWGAAKPLSEAVAYQFFPSITISDNDQVWVVWLETATASGYPKEEPDAGTVYYAVAVNGNWSSRLQLGHRDKAFYPSLSWNPYTKLTTPDIVWLEQENALDGPTYSIHAATNGNPSRLALKNK
ncbi:MAG: sialidase family protein [Chloroflexi bacterium]|nr:sialidase family protein [Chloroflexota bacterium]